MILTMQLINRNGKLARENVQASFITVKQGTFFRDTQIFVPYYNHYFTRSDVDRYHIELVDGSLGEARLWDRWMQMQPVATARRKSFS